MTDSIKLNDRDLVDGLRRFQSDFNKDFAIRDVYSELVGTLPKEEYMKITAQANRNNEERMDRLLFYYIYIYKNVKPLIITLKNSYNWLYYSVLNASNDKWIADYRSAIKDVPNNQDWNVHRIEYLWQIQQKLKSLKRGEYLILFGKLGFGKRWLATDACRDYGVISKMDYKIYWLNVSKCNTLELILAKLHRLMVLIQIDDLDLKYTTYNGNTKNEIIHLKNHLRKVLDRPEFRNCLIVLTDVQDENIIKAFDVNCKVMITTRHIEKLEVISSKCRQTIEIDKGFTLPESNELFAKAFDVNELPAYMTTFIEQVHSKCLGHPFIMSLIAKTFQNDKDTEVLRRERCKNWIKSLEQYTLHDHSKQIKMSVEESLKFLEPKQQECYKKMVIFTDNVNVPSEVLSKLWDTEPQATENMTVRFHKYSLIEKQSDGTCALHYVHYQYLKEEVSASLQESYHRQIVEKYDVRNIFEGRRELELAFPVDGYFHFFIGYHLLGAKEYDLFDMYLDFGFLEKKIRVADLPNTLGDLIKFKNYITRNDEYRKELLMELQYFLPSIEHLIFKSKDVTLLQLALTNDGIIQMEAKRQAQRYADRVWLNFDKPLDKHNQMLKLQTAAQPNIVRFVKPGESLVCLISLQDNNILLHDITPDYSNAPLLFRNEHSHSINTTITDMQIFRHQAFIVLNENGKLSVYNLKSTVGRRPSAPTRLNTNDFIHDRQPDIISNHNPHDKFTCFNILEQSESDTDLVVGTKSGILKFYKWKPRISKFESNNLECKTDFKNLFRMAHINDYVMLMNTHGDVKFFNLINSAQLAIEEVRWERQESPVSLHQGVCAHTDRPITLCVSAGKVIQVTHEKKRSFPQYPIVKCEFDEIYMAHNEFENDNRILSSALSKDSDYLILGTTRGIIVINRYEKRVIYRRNVSDQVLSLDVYRYPDEALYILISVFKDAGQAISLHSFISDKNEWSINNGEINFLIGEDLFDIKTSEEDDEWCLVAIDNKRNIQYKSSSDNFNELIQTIPFKYEIKKICFLRDDIIVGCTNGSVFKANWTDQAELQTHMMGEITYMENFNNTVIISCNSAYKILGMEEEFIGKATKAYFYKESTLLVVKKDCSIEFLDIARKSILRKKALTHDNTCVAQSYCNSLVAVATAKNNIFLWKINDNVNEEFAVERIEKEIDVDITSIAISPDKNVLAIGLFNGNIEIYDLVQSATLRVLESHTRPITNLIFSPWNETEGALILLSLSESINFWNITHIQNNKSSFKRVPTEELKSRASQRFKSPLKLTPPPQAALETPMQNLNLHERNWSSKTGLPGKRELLSCIRLIGKSAKKIVTNKDFTRFVTLDNEGNIYYLTLNNQLEVNQYVTDFNGNPANGTE